MKFTISTVAALLVLLAGTVLSAEPWKIDLENNLTMTQNAYSDNWVGGEASVLAWVFNSVSVAEKPFTSRVHNKNTLKLAFGQTHNQDAETKKWASPAKSTDLIDFETVFRFTFGWFADPFASGRIETQFLDASDPEKDRYVNPVKITESVGMAKVFLKNEKQEWTARLGAATRQLINRDLLDPVSSDRETFTSNDFGLEFVNDFKTPLAGDRITFTSKLTVYEALFYSEEDDLKDLPNEDYWKSPDVNWENVFTASITKYLMVNLYIQWLYDKEIDLGGRLKQTLSLGLTYNFSTAE
jgi:hypothetical protein